MRNCGYGKPEYRNYFFKSDAHNVVKFNGEGQPRYQQYHGTMLPGSVSGLVDGGDIKYVLADGTGPMSHAFDRNFRHFLWFDDVIYVIDDIHSHEPGEFEWLWHPGGKATKRGFDLEVTNGNSSVAVRPLYPRPWHRATSYTTTPKTCTGKCSKARPRTCRARRNTTRSSSPARPTA